MPAQGLGRCDLMQRGCHTVEQDIAMPAQGLGRCDRLVLAEKQQDASGIAMPAQGLGRCDSTVHALRADGRTDRNARAGAWTLRPKYSKPYVKSVSPLN